MAEQEQEYWAVPVRLDINGVVNVPASYAATLDQAVYYVEKMGPIGVLPYLQAPSSHEGIIKTVVTDEMLPLLPETPLIVRAALNPFILLRIYYDKAMLEQTGVVPTKLYVGTVTAWHVSNALSLSKGLLTEGEQKKLKSMSSTNEVMERFPVLGLKARFDNSDVYALRVE